MKLISVTILKGPSFWGTVPVAKCVLNTSPLTDTDKLRLQQRWQHCQKLIPRLPDVDISSESLALEKMAQAFTLLAIHLQTNGRQLMSPPETAPEVCGNQIIFGVPYEDRKIIHKTCQAAARILSPDTAVQANEAKNLTPEQIITEQALMAYQQGVRPLRLQADPAWLLQEFKNHGVPCEHLFENFLLLGQGKFQCNIFHTYGKNTAYTGAMLAKYKFFTNQLLKNANLPVPAQQFVTTPEMAQSAAEQIGFPVVLKPLDGKKAENIHVDLYTPEDVKAAYQNLINLKQQVIVEKLIPGELYRLLVIDGKHIATTHRIAGFIVGDGTHTVRELLRIRNLPYLGDDPSKIYANPLKLDQHAIEMVGKQGYTPDSCLKKDITLTIRRIPESSTGGTFKDVTNITHPDLIQMAERTARTIGLDMTGIDYITTDISKSFRETGGAMCEVNACPGLRAHYAVSHESIQDILPQYCNYIIPAVPQAGCNTSLFAENRLLIRWLILSLAG